MTVLEIIQRSAEFLQRKGVDSPRLQIELMLAHMLRLPRLKLYLNFERTLNEQELTMLREMVKRRSAREPLQHILGSTSFCGLEIKCSCAALIPRPETELLAERAWQFIARLDVQHPNVLDVGTGTGCIAIVVATHAPAAQIHAVDISEDALALARENAERHSMAGRIEFHHGDSFAALPLDLKFDLIVSNPPYIPSSEIESLQAEVRDFDPMLALDGGSDGLVFHRHIAREAAGFLKTGGKLMLEFADGQSEDVKKVFSAENWIVDEIVADYSARPRILIAHRGD